MSFCSGFMKDLARQNPTAIISPNTAPAIIANNISLRIACEIASSLEQYRARGVSCQARVTLIR